MLVTCVGVLVSDIIAADLPKVSGPGEVTIAPRGIELHIGGHSANVSIDLRKMGLCEGEVSSAGAVGADLFGDFVESVLKKHGVIAHLQRMETVGTSKDLILVVKGEDRRFHVEIGANWYLGLDHVRRVLAEEKPLIFYVGATGGLGSFDEDLNSILEEAKGYGCLTFIDPAVLNEERRSHILRALRWTDILHCNDIEASGLTGEKDPSESAEWLISEGVKLAIISMGERGLIARSERASFEMPVFKVSVIDPTGAGDAFCAGVMYKLTKTLRHRPPDFSKLSTKDLSVILLEGAASGAACVTAVGTTTAVTRENVDRLLNVQGSEILKRSKIKQFDAWTAS